jgi:ligand-binding sensor domain-containing protein
LRSSYCSLSQSAQSRAEQLPIRTYTTAEGLARDQVYKIVTDPRGFLWFCTTDGLSRFDGYEFVNYSVAQGLPHRIVYDLVISGKGDYWVATSAADFDKGVQMDIGVASLLVVSDTLFRSNKTGVNLSVGGV